MQDWRVVTLTQPFATLVVLGLKTIETRSRRLGYRGPLLIHAGLGPGYFGSEAALREYCQAEPCRTALAAHGIMSPGQLPRGAIVAAGYMVGCESTEWVCENNGVWLLAGGRPHHWALTEQEAAFGDYSPGRSALLFVAMRALATPIPARGQLGLWRWRGEVVYD